MKSAGRAFAAAILAALFGAAWVALLYAWHPALVIAFDRDLPRNAGHRRRLWRGMGVE